MADTDVILYDVLIDQEGYFNLFGMSINAPAIIRNITETQIKIAIAQGWKIKIVGQHAETENDLGEIISIDSPADLSKTSWKEPVDKVVSSLPSTATDGYRVINLLDNKIYTWVDGGWNSGVYPDANWTVIDKETDKIWTFDFDTKKWIVSSGEVDSHVVEQYEAFTIDATSLSEKCVYLEHPVIEDSGVTVQVVGGPVLQEGQDFIVTNDVNGVRRKVSWDGYGLDGILEYGDTLQVWYSCYVVAN